MASSAGQPDPLGDDAADEDLVAAINEGDQAAFAILYHRYKDWVEGLAYRFTGNHDDALDVLQETFSYLVRKFPGFVLTARMTTFLYPAVKNLSIAARRKRQRSTGGGENLDLFCSDDATDGTNPEDLHVLLSGLSDSHREILLMRFVDDLTQPEIADALELPLGTVKSRLHHAVNAVRKSPALAAFLGEDGPPTH